MTDQLIALVILILLLLLTWNYLPDFQWNFLKDLHGSEHFLINKQCKHQLLRFEIYAMQTEPSSGKNFLLLRILPLIWIAR